ncbi:MAG: hypothetical protein M3R00_04765 [Pseudomonadota bacterium]|nr:hypothetical protein [Pseudomonadota bacterium]
MQKTESKQERSVQVNKTIIHVVQGEIAVLNSKTKANTDLMTLGLSGCCAVLFIDEKYNIVFAHVDMITDLNFIREYAIKMCGKYTIDIIAHADHLNPMGKAVADYMKANFPAIKNSKGTTDIRKTKTGVVLVRPIEGEIKLLTPQRMHLSMLSRLNAQNRLMMSIPEDNPFRLDTLEEGDRLDQIRMFERSFESYCNEKIRMPTLVYENGWTGNFSEISDKVKALLQELIKCQNPKAQENCLNRMVLPNYKRNISLLIQMFPMYIHCLKIEEQQSLISTRKI